MAGEWYDSLPIVDTSLDNAFKTPELNVLDSLLGDQFKQQTIANYNNPDYEFEQAAAEQSAAARQREMERQQRRSELQSQIQYEDVPAFDRAIIGLGQGGLQLGRQAGGILDALMIPGGRALANASQSEYENLADLTNTPDRAEGLGGQFLQWFANNATSVIPSMAAGYGLGSFGASVAAAGAQTFGSVFEDARDAYERSGFDPGAAKAKAYIPALIAGAVTAGLTHWGGPTAIEPGQLSISAVREAIQQPIQTILKGFGKEATEEGLDQLSQGIVERFSYNPDKSLADIVSEAVQAGAAGGLLGGLGESAQVGRLNAARALRRGARAPMSISAPSNEAANMDLAAPPAPEAPAAHGAARPVPPMARWFDALQPVAPTSPVGPGILEPGRLPVINDTVPQFNPEPQPFPATMPPEVAAARAAMEEQAALGPGRIPNIQIDEFGMPGGFEQVAPPSAVAQRLATLRRGRNIQPGAPYAVTQGQAQPVSQYQGTGGQVENVGPDRNVAPVVQEAGNQAGGGNQLLSPAPGQAEVISPSTQPNGGVPNGQEEGFQEGQQEGVLGPNDVTQGAAGGLAQNTPAAPQYERPDDILDFIANSIGKIKGKKTARTGTEGYYGEGYKGLLRRAAVRNLFTNKGGVTPDQVVDDLRRVGFLPEGASVDDLWQAMDDAAQKRKDFRAQQDQFAAEIEHQVKQHDEFNQIAFQPRMIATPIATNDLLIGDEFSIGGEKFVVKNLDVDPETGHVLMVEAEDGKRFGTQRFAGDRVLNADKNSYKPNEAATEFLPQSELGMTAEEVKNLDRQINELKAKEKLTPDEFRQLEKLEQQRGQKFMELNDPVKIQAEQQQQAEMEQASARMNTPPPVVQQDMFGKAEPGQTTMLSLGQGGQGKIKEPKVYGVEGVRNLLDRVGNLLPRQTVQTIHAFLDMPVMRKLDWSGLETELNDFITGGAQGSRVGRLIKITTEADSATFPHEVAHILFEALPDSYKQAINDMRRADLAAKYGENVPAALDRGDMTSDEFLKSGNDVADYPLSSPTEYLAHLFGSKVAQTAFEQRHGKSAWARIKEWFNGLVDTVKRTLGVRPDIDRVLRELMAGRWQPNLQADVQSDEQFSFRRTAENAQNAAALVRTVQEQQVEGENQVAQSTNLFNLLVKHGAAVASGAAQKALRYLDLAGIKATGERLHGPGDYQSVKANNAAAPTRQKLTALATASQVRLMEANLDDVIQHGQEAMDQISRPAFQRKVARLATLKNEADNTEAINKASAPIFESAYRMAQRALRQESRNDVNIARLEASLKEIQDTKNSSSAMSHIVTDMVDVLSSTPKGIAILSDPNARRADMLAVYKDLKRSARQPMHNDSLLNWAAFILTRSHELRDQLWAAQLSRNSGIRAAMGAYGTKLAADLEKNPTGTIMREIRQGKNLQKKEDLARFAYRTLNKDVMSELDQAGQKIEAAQIASAVKQDPDFAAFRKEVYNDAGVEGRLESFTPGKDETFFLPDGKTAVDISMNGMRGTKVPTERWAQWEKARDELKDWLANNPDHPDYGVHEKNLQNLEEFYYNESIYSPHDREKFFSNGINTMLDAVRNAGGRFGAVVSKLVPRWSFLKEQAANWSKHWSQQVVDQRLKTLKSHGLKWKGIGGSMPLEVVNGNFVRQHLNQVLYSLNRAAEPLKVGDKTQSGLTVTAEDLNDARLQHEATKAGFKVIEDNFGRDNFVIDNRTGYVLQRKPGKTAEDLVPRILTTDGQQFLNEFKAARDEYRAAAGDTAKQAAATQKQIDLINQNWDLVAYPYLWDRNANFAQQTPFDGPGMAFQQIAELMQNNPSAVTNFDGLLNELLARSATTRQEAQEILLADMGSMFENGLKREESNLIVTPVTGEKKNAFTQARGAEVLPYSFYQYGYGNSRDVHRFSGAIHSRAYEKVLNGLDQLRKDMEARQDELKKRAQQVGMKEALNERRIQKANGDNYESLDDLDTRIAALKKIIAYMTQPEPEDSSDVWFQRAINGVQGSIIGNSMTTLRNVLAGPKYLASVMMRLNARGLFEYAPAYYQIMLVQTFAKSFPHLAKSLGLGTLKTLPALSRAVKSFKTNKGDRVRSFLGEAASAWLKETGELMYTRQKDIAEMQKRGLDFIPDNALEFRNKLGAGFLAAGELLDREIHGAGNKLALGVGSVLDILNTPLKGMFSAMGEHALNAGIVRTMEGKMGHKSVIQRALNKVYDRIQSGARPYDFTNPANPVNRLDYREVLGRSGSDLRLFSSPEDMANLEALYQDAGLSAQDEFFKYLKQRHEGATKPEYLKGEAGNLLANYVLGLVNKPTPMQQPNILQGRNKAVTFLRPLMGWSSRTLNSLHRITSLPSTVEGGAKTNMDLVKARLKQTAIMASLFILPALVAFSASGLQEEKGARLIAKYLWGQERGTRFPWEREGAKSQALGWLINATYGIPFVDMLINTMVNDMPSRASLDPNVVMLNKFKDIANYVGGVIQTGDPSFNLARLIEGFYPDSRAVLNRIESETGKRAGADVVALLRRNGPQDLIKPPGGPISGALYTELSPYGQRLENAALNEDWGKFKDIFNEAVDKAKEMGKDNPEKLVRQIFEARNPFTRALSSKMTNEQYTDFLDKLSPEERNKVEQVTAAFTHAGSLIDTTPTYTKEQRAQGRGSGGSSAGFSAPALSRAKTASPAVALAGGGLSGLGSLRGRKLRVNRLRLSRGKRASLSVRGVRRA